MVKRGWSAVRAAVHGEWRTVAGWPSGTSAKRSNELWRRSTLEIEQTADGGEKSELEALEKHSASAVATCRGLRTRRKAG